MDELTQEAIQNLLIARREIALKDLESSEEYENICEKQEESEKVVEKILTTLDKKQRIKIHRHYEDEIAKTNYEIEKAYIQGLRDCFNLIEFLKNTKYNI